MVVSDARGSLGAIIVAVIIRCAVSFQIDIIGDDAGDLFQLGCDRSLTERSGHTQIFYDDLFLGRPSGGNGSGRVIRPVDPQKVTIEMLKPAITEAGFQAGLDSIWITRFHDDQHKRFRFCLFRFIVVYRSFSILVIMKFPP